MGRGCLFSLLDVIIAMVRYIIDARREEQRISVERSDDNYYIPDDGSAPTQYLHLHSELEEQNARRLSMLSQQREQYVFDDDDAEMPEIRAVGTMPPKKENFSDEQDKYLS